MASTDCQRRFVRTVPTGGGSDSMALAMFSCQIRQLQQEKHPSLRFLRLHAFIVDHKARPDSTEEAKRVRDWLHEQFEWPAGVTPSKVPNFETEARRLRYKALGKACHEENIPNLLLGHHEADVKETLIMRLIEGYRGEGLRGIAAEADIPHCQGLYGAYQSGGREYTTTQHELAKALATSRETEFLPSVNEYRKPGFEYGGVRVYRPLLNLDKAALQNALVEASVPWVEDPTNHARTFSIRNAIRYLLQADLLPKALSGGSTSDSYNLMIAAGKIERKFTRRDEYAEELFQACDIITFDSRTGSLEVRIPMFTERGAFFSDCPEEQRKIERGHVGARLIRLLLSMLSPQDHVSLQSLEVATKAIFFDFTYANDFAPPKERRRHPAPAVFTAGGIYCERVDSPIGELPSESNQFYVLDPEYTWHLSRQPYRQSSPRPECVVVPTPHSTQEPTKKKGGKVTFSEPPWQLWDGRYWIQILNPTRKILRISPLTESRLFCLKSKLTDEHGQATERCKQLQKALRVAAPGSSRWTLPVIVDEMDNVLVLPTINFEVEESAIQWRVRYRRVSFPSKIRKEAVIALPEKELEGLVAAPLTPHHERMIAERRGEKAEKKAKKSRRKEEEIAERQKRMKEERIGWEMKQAETHKQPKRAYYQSLEKGQKRPEDYTRLREPISLKVVEMPKEYKSLEAQEKPEKQVTWMSQRGQIPPKKPWQLKAEKRLRKKENPMSKTFAGHLPRGTT
ncbi:MAG: hypothetical protein Q9223_003312 [Gallowayella weberi]